MTDRPPQISKLRASARPRLHRGGRRRNRDRETTRRCEASQNLAVKVSYFSNWDHFVKRQSRRTILGICKSDLICVDHRGYKARDRELISSSLSCRLLGIVVHYVINVYQFGCFHVAVSYDCRYRRFVTAGSRSGARRFRDTRCASVAPDTGKRA